MLIEWTRPSTSKACWIADCPRKIGIGSHFQNMSKWCYVVVCYCLSLDFLNFQRLPFLSLAALKQGMNDTREAEMVRRMTVSQPLWERFEKSLKWQRESCSNGRQQSILSHVKGWLTAPCFGSYACEELGLNPMRVHFQSPWLFVLNHFMKPSV